jgi:hypothetical protein
MRDGPFLSFLLPSADKTFMKIILLTLTFFTLNSIAQDTLPVDRNKRDDKFAGIERMRGWDDDKKDNFYKDLKSKSPDEVSKKYDDFDKDEVEAIKEK